MLALHDDWLPPSLNLQEPDEAPLEEEHLCDAITDAGYRIVKRHRNWEIYPHEIPPRLLDRLQGEGFRQAFHAKGRMSGLMERFPVHVVTEPLVGLAGATELARRL